jgi:hypothetical protein
MEETGEHRRKLASPRRFTRPNPTQNVIESAAEIFKGIVASELKLSQNAFAEGINFTNGKIWRGKE